MAASAYIDPVADPSGRLMAADIETIFRKSAGRLVRDRVRKRVYANGFPHPFEHELWSAKAADWIACRRRGAQDSHVSMPATDSLYSFSDHSKAARNVDRLETKELR